MKLDLNSNNNVSELTEYALAQIDTTSFCFVPCDITFAPDSSSQNYYKQLEFNDEIV